MFISNKQNCPPARFLEEKSDRSSEIEHAHALKNAISAVEHHKNRKSLLHYIFLFFGGFIHVNKLNVVPFSIVEIQAKIGRNSRKFPRDVSLDRQWLGLFR